MGGAAMAGSKNGVGVKGLSIVAVVAVVFVAVYFMTKKDDMAYTPAPVEQGGVVATIEDVDTSVYRDGTYTAVGHYRSPAGPEEVGITLVLEDGMISDASAEVKTAVTKSIYFQELFAGGLKEAVVGKSISSVSLDHVSGSSLTPIGFNDAVTQIKAQAKL